MNATFPFAVLALTFTLISCTEQSPAGVSPASRFERLHKTRWLLGKWGNTSADGQLTENWRAVNDSTYAGESYFVVGSDTVFAEQISLEQRGEDVSYVVTHSESPEPVSFRLTKAGKKLVFENPEHDFPQVITYRPNGTDSLVAEISGTMNGKPASEQFRMGKRR